MKFGKYLEGKAKEEWKDAYLDYKVRGEAGKGRAPGGGHVM